MYIKTLTVALLLGFCLPAAAQITTVQKAHEVSLSTVRFPETSSGTIRFKACRRCEYQTVRVTAETRWILNGNSVRLEEFKAAMDDVQDRQNEHLTVLHHLENDVVTRVSVRTQ